MTRGYPTEAGTCISGKRTLKVDPLPAPLTDGGDRSAVQPDEVLGNRESQSKASVSAADARTHLAERLEDLRQSVRVDAPAGIAHRDDDRMIVASRGNVNAAAFRRELDCIRHEIDHDLREPIVVGVDDRVGGIEALRDLDLPRRGGGADGFQDGGDERADRRRREGQFQLSA